MTVAERGGGGRGPEAILAILAGLAFLGALGSVDLWGKREQRAAAEALDTLREGHWLIAQVQARPRLEKPPLPRWAIAATMALTGRRDEWALRLPGALAALGTVALVYGLGRRVGGREAGRAAGLALASSAFFVSELRQAGNDGPLAFFVTLALYAAWRRLEPETAGTSSGRRGWALLFSAATGLGFLTKGPIVVLIVGLTVVPYLAVTRSLGAGLRRLADPWGALLFLGLAASWPAAVLLAEPRAWEVWWLEMAQKAGAAGVHRGRPRLPLAADWPWMVAPWGVVAAMSLALPFARPGRPARPSTWFPWCWAVANLAMLCTWRVAKPNYYVPCLPATAILVGVEWVRIARAARGGMSWPAIHARRVLQAHWVAFLMAALIAPAVAARAWPEMLGWTLVGSACLASGVVAGMRAWRRGADSGALAPIAAGLVAAVAIGYGAIAPAMDGLRGHRDLAARIDRAVPRDSGPIRFFVELDEGLWFRLPGRDLAPVPGTQPRFNKGFDLVEDARANRLLDDEARIELEKQTLLGWIAEHGRESPYLLIRDKMLAQVAGDLAPLADEVIREHGLRRNALVLLRLKAPEAATAGRAGRPARR